MGKVQSTSGFMAESNAHSMPDTILAAANWLTNADAVLVCAGAGMSAKDTSAEEAVYVSQKDFAKHYPFMLQHGYSTAYECMGLMMDSRVPDHAKWGFWCQHYPNMRHVFSPCDGYSILRDLVGKRDCFVLTSNVDGCFERAGWDAERVYTPQGDAAYYQCMTPCSSESVFEASTLFSQLQASFDKKSGTVDSAAVPQCPKCGGPVWMNLRGGDWFLHAKYAARGSEFVSWVESVIADRKRLVVIEIGAGFNTPTVTRFPCEAIVREAAAAGAGAALIRLNPHDAMVPGDLLRAVGISQGWQGLHGIQEACKTASADALVAAEARVSSLRQRDAQTHVQRTTQGSNFSWRASMESLQR